MIDKMCHMDYDEDMMCVVERRNPNNIVTLSHRFPGYHDLCNIVTISATCHITSLFSWEFGNACATFLFAPEGIVLPPGLSCPNLCVRVLRQVT